MPQIEEILLVHHTHTDPGYTGLHADVATQHARQIEQVLQLIDRDDRFRWTIEASWTLERFLAIATQAQRTRLAEAVRRGQIELTGFYLQPLTQLGDLESLYQSVSLTAPVAQACGATVRTAILDDVGGASFNLPQVLRGQRIDNLILGCGGWRVMLPYTPLPHLFFLEGVDGSRVLCWHLGFRRDGILGETPAQYGFGLLYFVWPMLKLIDGIQPVIQKGDQQLLQLVGREGIDLLLARLEREQYPYRTLLLQVACDNGGPEPRLLEAIEEWNRRFGAPRVRLTTPAEFFEQMRREYGTQIPLVRGELTCSWTEHAVTDAAATAQFRRALPRLHRAMACELARASGLDLASDVNAIDRNLAFHIDHTFGLSMWFWEDLEARYGSIRDRTFDTARTSWDDKARYARRATDAISFIEQQQRLLLSLDDAAAPKEITVFNPHLHAVNSTIEFITTKADTVLQSADGSQIDTDTEPVNTRWFAHRAYVRDVPGMGSRAYTIGSRGSPRPDLFHATEQSLESPEISLQIEPATGTIRSLRCGGREWANTARGGLNEVSLCEVSGLAPRLTYCGLAEDIQFVPCGLRSVRTLGHRSGQVSSSLSIEREYECHGNPVRVETHYILDQSRIRIRNWVRMIPTTRKHAMYFVFPFAIESPVFHVAQQGQYTQFPEERLAGSTNHNLGMQDFVAISNTHATALLASLDAPVISIGGPHYYHFGLEYPQIPDGTIYSLAMNNLWNTNCPVQQQGELCFEYCIAVHANGLDPVRAYQWARTAASPPVVLPGDASGHSPPVACSSKAIFLESIRPIADGIWQVRLVNVTRAAVTARVGFRKGLAIECDCAPTLTTKRDENSITLDFAPAECKTIQLVR